jgi:hypothetical protein
MYCRINTRVRSLNGKNFEWTTGHNITKKGFEGWFAKLVEYHKQNGTIEVLGDNKKKNLQLAKWGTMQGEKPSQC